jgi:hypothetical protein
MAATAGILGGTIAAIAASAADLGLNSERLVLIVGDEVTVHMGVGNAGPLAVWGTTLKHDPTRLELVAQGAGTATNFVADSRGLTEMNAAGEARTGGYALTNRVVAGEELAKFRYRAKAAGTTQIVTENRTGSNPFGNAFQGLGGSQESPSLGPAVLPLTILDASDSDHDGMSDAWESYYFGGTNAVKGGATDDRDGDGQSNLSEYRARTDPTDPSSALAVAACEPRSGQVILRWRSVTGKTYGVGRTGDLRLGFGAKEATGIAATPPLNTYTSNIGSSAVGFYRIELE